MRYDLESRLIKMKFENVAKVEKGFIEKSLAVQANKDGSFMIVASEQATGKNASREIEMTFSSNGFTALVGTLMAAEVRNGKKHE